RARALDIGSGSGVLLHALKQLRPEWTLAASDLSDRYRDRLHRMKGFEQLYTCAPDEIPGTFDLISMIHVLEHVPEPLPMLRAIRPKLGSTGLLIIQTPDARRNPFDLVVADHCSHFTMSTLTGLVARAGYEIIASSREWVSKELSLLVRASLHTTTVHETTDETAAEATRSQLAWLQEVKSLAHRLAEHRPFGVFGSSIAATWLGAELGGRLDFFVDEDPARVGRTFMGLPVLSPSQVPAEAHVFVGLAPGLARSIRQRLTRESRVGFEMHLPPTSAGPVEVASA
ncbi:MAG: methyltransferase domain-containing protein, partial [Chloroflexi bacterium]|nr:methyltransferase domain-containing protein [Chloroflexota bacterium]